MANLRVTLFTEASQTALRTENPGRLAEIGVHIMSRMAPMIALAGNVARRPS